MKKNCILILVLICCIFTGCQKRENEIDIPTLLPDSGHDDSDTSSPRRLEYEYDTYDGIMQALTDAMYRLKEDILLIKNEGHTNETYETLGQLLDTALAGKAQKYSLEYVKLGDNRINTGPFDEKIRMLFDQYPEQISSETDIINVYKLLCYISQEEYSLDENLFKNEYIYKSLFGNVGDPIQKVNADGSTSVSFSSYTGRLISVNGNYTGVLSLSHPNIVIHDSDIILPAGYSGNVTVAPLNEYGVIGNRTVIYIDNGSGISGEHEVFIYGDKIFLGTDDPEMLDAMNSKDTATKSIDEFIAVLKSYPNLQYLTMQRTGIENTYALFDAIPVSNIIGLDLCHNNISGGIDLSSFISVDILALSDNDIDNIVLSNTRTDMTEINIANTEISNLDFLSNVQRIGSLSIEGTSICNLDALSGKTIRTLSFSLSNDIDGIEALTEIKDLSCLYIDGEGDLPEDVFNIVKSISSLGEFIYNGKIVSLR